MMTKIAASLLTISLLAACSTTSMSTAKKRTTLREMYASNANAPTSYEPAPPAEGPEDVPAEGPADVNRNPALVPSPLLRTNAIGNP